MKSSGNINEEEIIIKIMEWNYISVALYPFLMHHRNMNPVVSLSVTNALA